MNPDLSFSATPLCDFLRDSMSEEIHDLQRQLKVYQGLVEVSALINGITASEELLPAILDVAQRVMEVEAASLFLTNPQGDLELAASSAVEGKVLGDVKIVVPRGRGISGWVLLGFVCIVAYDHH